MANCGPCLKLGLQLMAHYAADKSSGKDAECYYHHFGMPLPASIQTKIAQPKNAQTNGQPTTPPSENKVAEGPAAEKKTDLRTKDNSYLTSSRAGLTPDVCDQCWRNGHSCKAHCTVDNVRLCLDCAAGDPCAIAREKAASTRTPPHERYRVKLPGVKKPRATDIALVTDARGIVTGVQRIATSVPAIRPPASTTPQPKPAPAQVPTAGKDRQEEKEPMNTERLCTCKPGCTEIAKSNASPYAKGHKPDSKTAAASAPRSESSCGCVHGDSNQECANPKCSNYHPNHKEANAPATRLPLPGVSQPGTGIATICVTEEHMDNFWKKLSLEEKANLFQLQLEGA